MHCNIQPNGLVAANIFECGKFLGIEIVRDNVTAGNCEFFFLQNLFNLIETIASRYIHIEMYFHEGEKHSTEAIDDLGKRKKLPRLTIFFSSLSQK